MSPGPFRPRLLPHVLARRHVAGGQPLVVLYDSERLSSHRVGERTWLVLSAMDGTRDAEGIAGFCAAAGSNATPEEIRELIDELAAQGMVSDGVAITRASVAPPASAPSRPVRELPGFSLRCDGSGTCCRFYPSVAFTAIDSARARAARPQVHDCGHDPSRVFLPLYGSDPRASSVLLVDGRCAFLAEGGACEVHAAAGPGAKPLGCRTYPARFVDDGVALRVTPHPECACVFTSGARVDDAGGVRLVPNGARIAADLDPALHIEALPSEVLVAPGVLAPREAVSAWSLAVFDAEAPDAVASLCALSQSLVAHGLDVEASRRALTSPPAPPTEALSRAVALLAPRVQALAAEDWRGPADMVRVTATALANAVLLAQQLAADLAAGPGVHAAAERFYVRDLLFGHYAVSKQATRPMSLLLFDRAARALVARGLAVVAKMAELEDPAFRTPLALVEATMRGYGLNAYQRDLAEDLSPC